MWVDLLFEKWISQKFSDFENLLYVGEIKESNNAKMVVIFKDIYSPT